MCSGVGRDFGKTKVECQISQYKKTNKVRRFQYSIIVQALVRDDGKESLQELHDDVESTRSASTITAHGQEAPDVEQDEDGEDDNVGQGRASNAVWNAVEVPDIFYDSVDDVGSLNQYVDQEDDRPHSQQRVAILA